MRGRPFALWLPRNQTLFDDACQIKIAPTISILSQYIYLSISTPPLPLLPSLFPATRRVTLISNSATLSRPRQGLGASVCSGEKRTSSFRCKKQPINFHSFSFQFVTTLISSKISEAVTGGQTLNISHLDDARF